jgi:hypothetical protein
MQNDAIAPGLCGSLTIIGILWSWLLVSKVHKWCINDSIFIEGAEKVEGIRSTLNANLSSSPAINSRVP